MIKKISKIIYLLLKVIDLPLKRIFNRSFLIWFKDFIEVDSYIKIQIPNSKNQIKLFAPNYLTNWMSREFFEKEPETIEWINNFKPNTIFYDVGSNIGLYTIYAGSLNKNISVYSFEPSTNNLRVLSRNIYLNNFHNNIKIIPIPLSNKDGQFNLMKDQIFCEGGALNQYGVDYDFEGKKIAILVMYIKFLVLV